MFSISPVFRKFFETGLDVASNAFNNRQFFNVSRYIAIDLIDPRATIPNGPRPSVDEFIEGNFLEADLPASNLVMCVETIGITALFPHEKSLSAVEQLHKATLPGGTLVINVGPLTTISDRKRIVEILHTNFRDVKHIKYGRWSKAKDPITSFLQGTLLLLTPFIRIPKDESKVWHLFFAEGKLNL